MKQDEYPLAVQQHVSVGQPGETGGAMLLKAGLIVLASVIVFQMVALVVIVGWLLAQGMSLLDLADQLEAWTMENTGTLLVANAIGQAVGMGLIAVLAARLRSSQPAQFLRLRRPDLVLVALSLLGVVALMPVVQVVGGWNATWPMPEWVRGFEQSQLKLIEAALRDNRNVLFNLATLALVPAVFEELLFRGYFQRMAERGAGIAWGIVLSGLFFGLYHFRYSQLLPLVLLGIYLAWVVWRTGSLWTGILTHFVYNGSLVVAAFLLTSKREGGAEALEQVQVPGYIVALGLVLFAAIVYGMRRRAERLRLPPPSPI